MDTQQIPRQRPAWERAAVEEQMERYRAVVNDVFAHHRRVCEQSGRLACSCGGAWPCAAERLAAQLFDWV